MTKLNEALDYIERQFGKRAVIRMGDEDVLPIEAIPSGCMTLDLALGIHGFPRGRIVEVYGPECLHAQTLVQYAVRTPDGRRQNTKGGAIERLWHRFHGVPMSGRGNYQREASKDAYFTAPSMTPDGQIVHNRIEDVVAAGTKECYRVTTDGGEAISASEDHRFWTGDQFVRLADLRVGDRVYVHRNVARRGRKPPARRAEVSVLHHPNAPRKRVRDAHRGYINDYRYLSRARLVYEASLNDMSPSQYRAMLNSGRLSDLIVTAPGTHIHHRDGNALHDVPSNLECLTPGEHSRLHAVDHAGLNFMAVEARITGIEPVGEAMTYDLCMAEPHHNFVADGFVVHNSSGKTTLLYHVIASAQAMGLTCAFIDAEHAVDPVYARNIGVDVDNLLLSQPDYGEQALEIADILCRSGEVGIVAIDSVAALVPKAELEGQMGDASVGLQARMMSQAMRKLAGNVSKTKTLAVFSNQIREKVGVIYGSPETQPGGRALKFYSSMRLDIRRIETIKQGNEAVANKVRVKVVKNKCAAPYREAVFEIEFGHGISTMGALIDMAAEREVITKSGSWYSYEGEKLGQGRQARAFLTEHPDVAEAIRNAVIAI